MRGKPNTEIAAKAKEMAQKVRAALKQKFGDDEAAARAYLEAEFAKAKRKVEREMEAHRRRRKPRKRECCDGCGAPELGPVLRDDVWKAIAEPREALCFNCILGRMVKRLNRMPRFADLRPCRWNLFHQPNSWFDVFVGKLGEPDNIAEWRKLGADRERAR
jgi:hypothetical protein